MNTQSANVVRAAWDVVGSSDPADRPVEAEEAAKAVLVTLSDPELLELALAMELGDFTDLENFVGWVNELCDGVA